MGLNKQDYWDQKAAKKQELSERRKVKKVPVEAEDLSAYDIYGEESTWRRSTRISEPKIISQVEDLVYLSVILKEASQKFGFEIAEKEYRNFTVFYREDDSFEVISPYGEYVTIEKTEGNTQEM